MDLLGKKGAGVAGCGKSGLGAAGLLQKAGAVPVLFDENEKLDEKALCAREDYPKDTALGTGKPSEGVAFRAFAGGFKPRYFH